MNIMLTSRPMIHRMPTNPAFKEKVTTHADTYVSRNDEVRIERTIVERTGRLLVTTKVHKDNKTQTFQNLIPFTETVL